MSDICKNYTSAAKNCFAALTNLVINMSGDSCLLYATAIIQFGRDSSSKNIRELVVIKNISLTSQGKCNTYIKSRKSFGSLYAVIDHDNIGAVYTLFFEKVVSSIP